MQGGNREQLLLFDMLGYKGLARSQTKFLNNLFQSNGVGGEESVSHERELVLKKRVTAAVGDSDDSSDQSVHSDDSNESNDHRDDKQLNIQPQHSRFDIYQESSIKVSAIMHSRNYVVEAKI